MSNVAKQLKKNDFLAHVTEEPMTREQLVDALGEFEFISSYLDYLTDHFVRMGKVIRAEDGTLSRKPKAAAASRDAYRVVGEDGTYSLEHKILATGEDLDKDGGWATTAKAAKKRAASAVFQDYKASVELIKAVEEPVEVEQVKAA